MLRILLADDHAVVRQGVKQILAEAFVQATFGEARNVHELLELVGSQRWDIVVLDLAMPGGNGLEALKQIKYNHPQLPVLILSMFPEDQYAVRTIQSRGSGLFEQRERAGRTGSGDPQNLAWRGVYQRIGSRRVGAVCPP